ncbi:Uncharacterised protein [Serratia entomophila]|nr:Uncharacterised protein [Serratia entomophila]
MFPLNQDTLIVCSGHTANYLYSDGYGCLYDERGTRVQQQWQFPTQ